MITPLKIAKQYSWLLLLFFVFYILAVVSNKYFSNNSNVKSVALQYEAHYKSKQNQIATIFNKHEPVDLINVKDVGVLVEQSDSLNALNKYYNNNYTQFKLDILPEKKDTSFLQYSKGNIIEVYQKYNSAKKELVQIVFPIQTNYGFLSILNFEQLDKQYFLDTLPSTISYQLNSKFKFFLNKNTTATNQQYNTNTIIFGAIAFVFFFVFLYFVTQEISIKCSFYKGFLLLLLSLLTLRFCLYEFAFPVDVSKLSLFDPTIYASNKINKSLGDLLLNTTFISWIFTFLRYHDFAIVKHTQKKYPRLVGLLQILLFFYLTIISIRIIHSLVLDSKIPLNVMEFYNLNRFTVAAFAALCSLVFLYLRILNLFFLHFVTQNIGFIFQAICIVISCLFFIFINPTSYIFYAFTALWLTICVAVINTNWFKRSIKEKTFGLLLSSILFFSASCSLVFQNQINSLDKVQQNKTAERIHALYGIENEFIVQCKSYENIYDIGIYKNDTLIHNFGNFPYATVKNNSLQSNKFPNNISVTNYDKDGLSIFLVKQNTSLLLLITLFNYFVVSFLLMSFLVVVIPKLFFFDKAKYKAYFKLTIRSKILAIVVSATIGVYIVLAIFAIRYFVNNFDKGIEAKLIVQGKQISSVLQSTVATKAINSITQLNKSTLRQEFDNVSMINFYQTNGIVLGNTQSIDSLPNVPKCMKFNMLQEFKNNNPLFIIANETVDNLSFKSIYFSIIHNKKCIGYFRLPFEKVEAYLQQETSGLISTLVNLSALFFIIIFMIVYYFANQLTNSLTIIGSKMNKINLNEVNETIEWKRNDEIGALVNQYNKMVLKLTESAKVLALNEREGAWKEMAKQVAHEIKNPLTPMKLSIQHLQYQVKQHPQKAEELTNKVVTNLVQQIDQLAKIANDFSQFASITSINPMKFDIREVLDQLQELYKGYTTIKFTFSLIGSNKHVFADKLQINRLFTNLVKNAIEACEAKNDENAQILIQQVIVGNSVIISVCDSGNGIQTENISNIFKPNFTTKNSGTGLGLAMCKGIVENANGKIWFETSTNGTTFFVELPLVE